MKVNFYLKNPKGDYETWIYCKVRYQGNELKIYTDKKIEPQYWNADTQTVRQTKKFANHSEYNRWLKNIADHADKIETDWINKNKGKDVITPIPTTVLKEALRKYLAKPTKEEKVIIQERTFWGYYNNFLFRMQNGTRTHLGKGTPLAAKTIFQFENLQRHLENFEKKNRYELSFENITLTFYNKFIDYLTIDLKLAPNTIGKLITNIKVFMREALEDGITTNNTFTHRKFKSIHSKSDTVYLTIPEIKELLKLDLSKKPSYERVRDTFVIGCYTGLRFSDVIRIKPSNIIDGMIEITPIKTDNHVVIPMVKEVTELLNKYNNKLHIISNQKYNEYLYEVCKECDILKTEITINEIKGGKKVVIKKPKYEFISSHTARRSFATNEYKAGDLEVSEIMAITGHTTEKSFYKYIRETPKETANRIKEKIRLRELKPVTHLKAV